MVDRRTFISLMATAAAAPVREGSNVVNVPATMSVFRIANDGKLTYVNKYDVDVGKAFMWWMGMVAL
jgi:hypothetical protein